MTEVEAARLLWQVEQELIDLPDKELAPLIIEAFNVLFPENNDPAFLQGLEEIRAIAEE